eukprot:SAG31_NODE_2995_length_4804_cov_9.959192_1_plen_326_part_00
MYRARRVGGSRLRRAGPMRGVMHSLPQQNQHQRLEEPEPEEPEAEELEPERPSQNATTCPLLSSSISSSARTLVCIRHGQSIAQACPHTERKQSVDLLDASLSNFGIEQCKSMAASLSTTCSEVELVVVSPLTRALQTALLLFGSTSIPILVHPAVAEIGSIPENTGRPLRELQADPKLRILPRFTEIDLSLLVGSDGSESNWPRKWQACASANFVKWLAQDRSERNVALVSHSNFLGQLMPWRQGPTAIPNCQPQTVPVDALCRLRCGGFCNSAKLKEDFSTREWKRARKGVGLCKVCAATAPATRVTKEGRQKTRMDRCKHTG